MIHPANNTIFPVWATNGKCLTDMYVGFNNLPHIVPHANRNGKVFSNIVKDTPTRKRIPKAIKRQYQKAVEFYTPPKVTAADHGITKVLIKYGE